MYMRVDKTTQVRLKQLKKDKQSYDELINQLLICHHTHHEAIEKLTYEYLIQFK